MSGSVPDPPSVHGMFSEFYKAGDLDGCVNMYEDDSVFIDADGQWRFLVDHPWGGQ